MKLILIILLACGSAGLLPATLEASDRKPIYKLKIVDYGAFYYADDFWKTPAGIAFWETTEGKAVLQTMLQYPDRTTFWETQEGKQTLNTMLQYREKVTSK